MSERFDKIDGALAGAIAGTFVAVVGETIYALDVGSAQWSSLQTKIETAQSSTHQFETLKHETTAVNATPAAHAATPWIIEKINQSETYTKTLTAEQKPYHEANLGLDLGGAAGLVAVGAILGVLARNAFYNNINAKRRSDSEQSEPAK